MRSILSRIITVHAVLVTESSSNLNFIRIVFDQSKEIKITMKSTKPICDKRVRVHSHRASALTLVFTLALTLEEDYIDFKSIEVQRINASFKNQMGSEPIKKRHR